MPFIKDGHQTLILITANPFVRFKEREVQPLGLDGGGEIDTTTMRNNRWRTKYSKSLITGDDTVLQVNYDPSIYSQILAILNVNTVIDLFFPDGSALAFWGWVDKFTPASLKEGEFPLAELRLHCSNRNNIGNEVEATYYAPDVAEPVEESFEQTFISASEVVAGAGGDPSGTAGSLAPNIVGD
jgi:hypothetical protein